MVHSTPLAAKVAAQNEANRIANAMYLPATEALKPFIGQKVCKVDGGLLEKVKKVLPEASAHEGNHGQRPYYSTGHGYSLTLQIRICEEAKRRNGEQGSYYSEAVLYVADLRDGVLIKLYDPNTRRTDYTEAEIIEARKAHEAAKTAVREAASKLVWFGEYDQ